MANALKFVKLVGGEESTAYNFTEQEVIRADVKPAQNTRTDRAARGKPTLMLLSDPYHVIDIVIRVDGFETLDKLNSIRKAILAGSDFRCYPALIDESAAYFDGFMDPQQLVRRIYHAGQNASNERLQIQFIESISNSSIETAETG